MLVTKRFTPRVSLKAETPGALTVEFATLNVVDLDGDVTIPGAFGKQSVRIQPFGHDTRQFSIGKGTISESGDKAVLEGLLNLDMEMGREAHAALKFDMENGEPLQEWSYIFEILDADFGEQDGRQVRILKRLKVHSVDPVFLGAGIGTRTTGVKALFDRPFTEFLDEAESLVKELVRRAKDRSEFREKEGRTLSAANVARLSAIAASLSDASGDLLKMLDDAAPKSDDETAAELLKERLLYERVLARI